MRRVGRENDRSQAAARTRACSSRRHARFPDASLARVEDGPRRRSSAAGQNFTAGFNSTGDNAWVGFQGQNYEVGKAAVARINRQIRRAAGTNKNKGLSQFGSQPRDWIKDAQDEGSAKVDGVETDHV